MLVKISTTELRVDGAQPLLKNLELIVKRD